MFQVDHFKITTEELPYLDCENKNITEAINRTTIGRYYYYIFLTYRETIYRLLTVGDRNEIKKKKRNIHYLIQKTMACYDRTDISGKLGDLKKLRNSCDYDLTGHIDNNNVNYAKDIVFQLEKELTSIKAGAQLNDAFIKALKEI